MSGNRKKTQMVPKPKLKTCEACGATFVCRQGACWCDAVELRPDALERLQSDYSDCLCEACLRAIASRHIAAPGATRASRRVPGCPPALGRSRH